MEIKNLDKNFRIQKILNSKNWANDNRGLLVNRVIRIICKLGYTEGQAYEYLQLS